MAKVSDIFDSRNNKFIMEGDICLLHNWGSLNDDQPIAVAELFWDSQYHQWDFRNTKGYVIEDRYDLWRTSPRVIGRDGKYFDEFVGAENWSDAHWTSYFKEQEEIADKKSLDIRKKEENKKKIERLKQLTKEVEQLKKELEEK